MQIVKWFLITIVVSVVIGFGLAYFQEDKDYETTIQVKSYEKKEYIEDITVSTFPKVNMKYNDNLTGKGKFMFESELYSPIFIKIEAPGYKTKRGFYLLNATEEHVLLLEQIEEKENDLENKTEDDKTSTQESEPKDETKKVDMIPTFK